MDIRELSVFMENIEERMQERQRIIAAEILKEIRAGLDSLLRLDSITFRLTGGPDSFGRRKPAHKACNADRLEAVNVLYILDEPSIGLHQRDNRRLITSLKRLRDAGNSVIVVEHDKEMIQSSDYIIDMGPVPDVTAEKLWQWDRRRRSGLLALLRQLISTTAIN